MKFFQPQTLQQIALILNCDYVGDDNFPVLGMNEIHVVKSGDSVNSILKNFYNHKGKNQIND